MNECCVGSVAGCQTHPDCTTVGGTWNGSSCTGGREFSTVDIESVTGYITGDGTEGTL